MLSKVFLAYLEAEFILSIPSELKDENKMTANLKLAGKKIINIKVKINKKKTQQIKSMNQRLFERSTKLKNLFFFKKKEKRREKNS